MFPLWDPKLPAEHRAALMKRLTDQGVLIRAVRGVYVNPLARSLPADVRRGLLRFLRPREISYVSLESKLSEAGAISQITAQTQQQLPFNQAIVARLGALRALSFRGVTSLGNDIYMAHFANGSAEWRIGLVKDGTIGRIALGPQ